MPAIVSTLGAFADKRGDCLGGATIEASGGLGAGNGGTSTFGHGITLGSGARSVGKSKSVGRFGRCRNLW